MRRPRQRTAPWGTYCCAEAADIAGWSWGKMARALRARGGVAAPSMRGVRISPAQLAALVRQPGAPVVRDYLRIVARP